jgi:hypothetical protein
MRQHKYEEDIVITDVCGRAVAAALWQAPAEELLMRQMRREDFSDEIEEINEAARGRVKSADWWGHLVFISVLLCGWGVLLAVEPESVVLASHEILKVIGALGLISGAVVVAIVGVTWSCLCSRSRGSVIQPLPRSVL